MRCEDWWLDTDRGKPKQSEKNLSQHHFSQHKSHLADLGSNLDLLFENSATIGTSHGMLWNSGEMNDSNN